MVNFRLYENVVNVDKAQKNSVHYIFKSVHCALNR